MTLSTGQVFKKTTSWGMVRARSWTWSRTWTGSRFVRKSFHMRWGGWESFYAWRRAGCGSDEGRTDTVDSQWCPCLNQGGSLVGDCPGRALAVTTLCMHSSVRVSCLMPERLAAESGSVLLPSKPSGEPFTRVLFPPAPWQSGRNRNLIYSFHPLALIDKGVIRARTPCCSSHLTAQTCTSRTRRATSCSCSHYFTTVNMSPYGRLFFF